MRTDLRFKSVTLKLESSTKCAFFFEKISDIYAILIFQKRKKKFTKNYYLCVYCKFVFVRACICVCTCS